MAVSTRVLLSIPKCSYSSNEFPVCPNSSTPSGFEGFPFTPDNHDKVKGWPSIRVIILQSLGNPLNKFSIWDRWFELFLLLWDFFQSENKRSYDVIDKIPKSLSFSPNTIDALMTSSATTPW